LTSVELPVVRFEVKCSKGTYIRSLAHDFGKALNSGAYLSELRRTEIGDFKVDDAQSIEDFLEFKI
jgi:tRNA pseudouridine55 synthase